MSIPARASAFLGLILGLWACSGPPSFRMVGLSEAQQAVQTRTLVVIEALELPGRAADPKAAEVPAGRGVLVFGMDERAARARAAAFARAGNQPVLVFVPRDADERGRFYAVASQDREDRRGKDS